MPTATDPEPDHYLPVPVYDRLLTEIAALPTFVGIVDGDALAVEFLAELCHLWPESVREDAALPA